MSSEGVLETHGGGIPNLNSSVPRGSGQHVVLGVWGVSNTAYPIIVAVSFRGVGNDSNGLPDLEEVVS